MKQLAGMIILFLLLAVAGITNPGEEHHKEGIIAKYQEQNDLSAQLGVGHAIAEMTSYHNYIFFSTTSIGEEKISTGYLGRVSVRSLVLSDLPHLIIERLPENVRSLFESQET